MTAALLSWLIASIFAIGASTGTSLPQPPTISFSHATSTVATVTNVVAAKKATTVVTQKSAAIPKTVSTATTPTQTSSNTGLSNDNTYTNSIGNTVHSPAYSTDATIPVGATAQCRDGSYSFSQHRSGTCSHHGGVASWL